MLIVHLTSAHPPSDARIFYKMCRTLVKAGYDVNLVFASQNGESKSIVDNVVLYGIASLSNNRLQRMIFTTWRVYRKAFSLNAAIYHFHDPELIPYGILLKLFRKRVIYDVHEDYASSILDRQYLPTWSRPILGHVLRKLERFATLFFDGIVAATPKIARQFDNRKSVIVQNFPVLEKADVPERTMLGVTEVFKMIYIGGISRERGLFEMLEAGYLLSACFNVTLTLAGTFDSEHLQELATQHPGWSSTNFTGWVPRTKILHLLSSASVGLVLFHPRPNHIAAQPNKLFEYMEAGLPVVASDFPLWSEIVKGAGCGLVVDPLDPKEIANAIRWLVEHHGEAEEMGKRGRQAVMDKYNWGNELPKLVTLYHEIMKN